MAKASKKGAVRASSEVELKPAGPERDKQRQQALERTLSQIDKSFGKG